MTLEDFVSSEWNLVATIDSRTVFSSDASDLIPLVELIEQFRGRAGCDLSIYDRYVGRAGALLMTPLRPKQVFAGTISDGGVAVLTRAGIPFTAGERVPYLMGKASEGMCRWERLSRGMSPAQFYEAVRIAFDRDNGERT
ncbi:MAG: DUF1893 domain-containing protein [Candidatus Zixiibacteriota bacterium]|nr:MAG: DUF1893 domain-containing protein [candidate division Zixibacteria bacterium]